MIIFYGSCWICSVSTVPACILHAHHDAAETPNETFSGSYAYALKEPYPRPKFENGITKKGGKKYFRTFLGKDFRENSRFLPSNMIVYIFFRNARRSVSNHALDNIRWMLISGYILLYWHILSKICSGNNSSNFQYFYCGRL